MENDGKPRARRRLRQRSPQTDALPKEVIIVDSSSDDFVPSSGDEHSGSDDGNVNKTRAKPLRQDHTTTSTKKRGFKRLRPASDGNEVGETSQECSTPAEPEEWECVRCTYLNEPQRLACEICLTMRPMAKQTRKLSAWLTASAATPAKAKASKAAQASDSIAPLETIDSSDEGEANNSQLQSQSRAPSHKTDDLWATSRLMQSSSIAELCVQKKKVQEVQAWLQQSVPSISPMHGLESMRKRLVFVCGPPGSGKSTTVRHLANVMGVDVKEWRDNATAGKLQYHRYLRDEIQTPQVSAWDDFIDFINRSINYSALQVATVPDNRRRSRKRALESTPSQPRQQLKGTARDQLILIESWPENPFASQDATTWDEKLKTAFRQIVNPAANLRFPVVCIFSDVRDKRMDAVQLAKVFSDDVVHSPFTSIINFNPVTTAQMKKALLRMLDKMDSTISLQELQKIIDRSDGDIRHATNMVQLMQKRQPLRQKSKHERSTSRKARVAMLSNSASSADNAATLKDEADDANENEDDDVSRDPFFSDFHIVGKLLHSKNKKPDAASSSSSSSARLTTFDRILDSSAMSLDRVLSLLHSNCVDYFTEIDDLEKAVELMSLSEMWLHGSYRTTSSSLAFKTSHDVVRSVVVRSIALTNDHPAPSAFRPITAPKTYETAKRMVHGRQDALRQLQAMADAGDAAHAYVCKGDVYAFEMQPFVELMRRQSRRPTMMLSNHKGTTGAEPDEAVDDEIEHSDGDGW